MYIYALCIFYKIVYNEVRISVARQQGGERMTMAMKKLTIGANGFEKLKEAEL